MFIFFSKFGGAFCFVLFEMGFYLLAHAGLQLGAIHIQVRRPQVAGPRPLLTMAVLGVLSPICLSVESANLL